MDGSTKDATIGCAIDVCARDTDRPSVRSSGAWDERKTFLRSRSRAGATCVGASGKDGREHTC